MTTQAFLIPDRSVFHCVKKERQDDSRSVGVPLLLRPLDVYDTAPAAATDTGNADGAGANGDSDEMAE